MNRNNLNIGDYVTVFTIPYGYVIGQVMDITKDSYFYNGYAVKVQLKFDRYMQTMKNQKMTTDLDNIEPVETALNEVKKEIDKLSTNLRLAQETINSKLKSGSSIIS